MNINEILQKCDHTLLNQDCSCEAVMKLCDEAIKYGCASVCIPPCHVVGAKKYVQGRVKICTVIGFPNGYMTTAAKAFEAENAVKQGADEIDMVINISMVKDGCWQEVLEDIRAVRERTRGKILKVIIEACLLTRDEKIKVCELIGKSGADFVKTSTGFSTGGATFEDVKLLRECSPPNVKVKASGGIATLEQAEELISLGAERLGASKLVKCAIAMENEAKAPPVQTPEELWEPKDATYEVEAVTDEPAPEVPQMPMEVDAHDPQSMLDDAYSPGVEQQSDEKVVFYEYMETEDEP